MHDHLLHSFFMLKPFILDISSPAYKKQFEHCKLDQALLISCTPSPDYMCPGPCRHDSLKHPTDLHNNDSEPSSASPCYKPYPTANSPSFLDSAATSTLCIHVGFKGNRVASCSSDQSSCPERPIIVTWKTNHLDTADGTHGRLHFNDRINCRLPPSACHGSHSFSLCGNTCHSATKCNRN